MPAIYAHERFGRRVWKQLDKETSEVINKHLDQFRIGLQGPDFLFFYKIYRKTDVRALGYRMHGEPARGFLEAAAQVLRLVGEDSPEAAYIYGFICHFTLDSECHPYVAEQIEETGVGHIEIESEFDKYLMRADKKQPTAYPLGWLIPTDDRTAACVGRFYPSVKQADVGRALKDMRRIKLLLTAPKPGKRAFVEAVMHLLGDYDSQRGHLINEADNIACEGSVRGLEARYMAAEELAARLIAEYKQYVFEGVSIGNRFDRTFE